jgi:hypothetical protein
VAGGCDAPDHPTRRKAGAHEHAIGSRVSPPFVENQRCLGPQPPFQRLRPRLAEPASDPAPSEPDAEITTVRPAASSDGRRHHLLDQSKRLTAQLALRNKCPRPNSHEGRGRA